MSVYDIFFVFGKPGTYVLDCSKRCIRRNTSSRLDEAFNERPVKKILSLALDCNDNFFSLWVDTDKEKKQYVISGGAASACPNLKAFEDKQKDKYDVRASFGTDVGDFIAFNISNGAWQSVGAPAELTKKLQDLKDSTRIRAVTMGINGAFAVVFTNGSLYYACNANYPSLWKVLESSSRGDVVFVAMNPHRDDEYFLVLANGEVHVKASAVCERDVEKILSSYPNLEVITSSVVKRNRDVSTTVGLPPQARKKAFVKAIATSVGNGLVGAGISAIFGACTVM